VRSSPAIADGVVVVSAGGLYGLRPADGAVLWQRTDLEVDGEVSPLLVGDTVYVTAQAAGRAAALVAVKAATGADAWLTPAPLPAGFDGRAGLAAYPEMGLLFAALGPPAAASATRPSAGPNAVLALQLADGSAAWSAPLFPASPPPVALSLGWIASTPALPVPQSAVFLAAGQRVTALSASTGAPLWSRTLPEKTRIGPPVVSTAAEQGSTLFVGGASGRIYALDSTTGADTAGGLDTPLAPIIGPLALAGTTLFAPTASGLIAIDTSLGTPIWSNPVAASGVAIANGMLLVTTADGRLVGFSR
jgi:outer membrane protein assembly factor BamB